MKKTLLTTFAITVLAGLANGQGLIGFNNSFATPHKWINALGVNQGNITSNMPVAQQLVVGIFVGVDGSSLRMMPEMPLATFRPGNAGGVATVTSGGNAYPIPGFAGGAGNTPPFAQVRLWNLGPSADRAWDVSMMTVGDVFGQTDIRQLKVLAVAPATGTAIWQGPTGNDPNLFRPIIAMEVVPEPSTLALGAIGLGSLLFLRRRKVS